MLAVLFGELPLFFEGQADLFLSLGDGRFWRGFGFSAAFDGVHEQEGEPDGGEEGDFG